MTTAHDNHPAVVARNDLLYIVDAWPDLLDQLGNGARGAGSERVSGTPTPGLVINEHVSLVIREVVTLTRQLTGALTEADRWNPSIPADDPVRTLRHIARNHVGHFTEHPEQTVRELFTTECNRLHHRVKRAAYPTGRRTITTSVRCETDSCEGWYTALVDPDKRLLPDLICNIDRTHRLTPLEYQRAGRRKHLDPTAATALIARINGGAT